MKVVNLVIYKAVIVFMEHISGFTDYILFLKREEKKYSKKKKCRKIHKYKS